MEDIYYFDSTGIETLLRELTEQNEENHEIIISVLTDINDIQTGQLVSSMLVCGLLGLIIGIFFVNIFKSR